MQCRIVFILYKAHELHRKLRELTGEDGTHQLADESSVMSLVAVHQAMGILRQRVSLVKKLNGEYYSSSEMCVDAQKQFVDPLLYNALGWLTNERRYRDAADADDEKCLNIACDIITLATSVASSKHLGLAAHVHHQFGSRQLVDDLHHMGYCVSYTEIRQFETSAAQYVCSKQLPTKAGSYLPPEITPSDAGGKFVVAAADNWDHNERTTDGKRTTHAMTSILVQRSESDIAATPRIKRVASRSLDLKSVPGRINILTHFVANVHI